MPGIFISYRREDTAGHAGRIFDRLKEKFGRDKVFMDVAGIEPGVDFVQAIDQAVGACDVLLVIIGKKWLACTDALGNRRLDDPKDFVRLEAATALRRNIRVIPVLVQDAAMPGEGDLPDDLKKLARRQATEISDTHWDSDTQELIETLAKLLPDQSKPAQIEARGRAHAPAPAEEKRETSLPVPFWWGKNRFTWIISSISAVVVAGLLFFLVPGKVLVPNLVGISLDEAIVQLGREHLRPGTVKSIPADRPPGSVIEQDPVPGSRIPSMSAVNLVLAEKNLEKFVVPDLVGITLDEAVARLEREQLRPGSVRTIPADQPAGTVIEQDPVAGSQLLPESPVNLVLAEKKPEGESEPTTSPEIKPAVVMATVPKLVGQPLKKAHLLLEKAGLKPAKAVQKETREAPEGIVIVQAPMAGTKLARGKMVELVVAISPPKPVMVPVPDVRGLDVKRAVAILKDARLSARMERVETTEAEPGTVLKQSLKPGSQVGINETVLLVYAVAHQDGAAAGDIVLPDFTGSPIQKVEVFLKEAGLVLGPVHEKATNEQRAGTVLGQRPQARTRMEKGSKVLLLVAVSAGEEGAVLPAPEQTLPQEGMVFHNLPRTTSIRWKAVSGAASYIVELDCLNCCASGKWCSELGRPWKVVRGIRAVSSPGYKFEFPGAQPGRWRVWAVDHDGREGEKSPWRTFRYSKLELG